MLTAKFRHPETNKRYTAQLFWDLQRDFTIAERTTKAMFTLHHDYPGLINFRKEYLKDMDPTGYKTGSRLLENYDHFLFLMKSSWFKEAKKEWDKELSAKMEQEATDVLMGIMKSDEVKVSEKITAAKVMLGKAKTIIKEPPAAKGRPSKEEVIGVLKEEARLSKEEADDLARIKGIA